MSECGFWFWFWRPLAETLGVFALAAIVLAPIAAIVLWKEWGK